MKITKKAKKKNKMKKLLEKNKIHNAGFIKKTLQLTTFFLTILLISNISTTKIILISSILILLILIVSWVYYSKVYKTLQFTIFTILSFLIFWFVPGLLGIYFFVCLSVFILLYLYTRLQYFIDLGFLASLGFSITFLFFKFYFLCEVENILFVAQDIITFTGNPDSLTLTFKIMLENSYLSYPDTELQFLLSQDGFGDLLSFLSKFKDVGSITNFIAVYAYVIHWILKFIPFIKIYLIII